MQKNIAAYHEDLVVQTFMVLIQVAREVIRYTDSYFFNGLRLSMVKYIVLKALVNSEGTLNKSDLAAWTDTTRHNITTLVKRMELEGLVTTVRNEEDKRFQKVTITDKGREIFAKATVSAYDIINKVMSDIDKLQAAQLDGILKVIKNNMRTPPQKNEV
jgi:DNA-binding MarR family transcriptional regulator